MGFAKKKKEKEEAKRRKTSIGVCCVCIWD